MHRLVKEATREYSERLHVVHQSHMPSDTIVSQATLCICSEQALTDMLWRAYEAGQQSIRSSTNEQPIPSTLAQREAALGVPLAGDVPLRVSNGPDIGDYDEDA